MLVVGVCFAFMIFSVYTAFSFLIPPNNENMNLVVSLTTFLNTFTLILFVFGTSAMGQLVKSEVKNIFELKCLGSSKLMKLLDSRRRNLLQLFTKS